MELDPRETAVVLIEYQNDFTSEGGALHGAVADVMESTGMLANTADAVEAGPRRRRDDHPRADLVRRGLRRDQRDARTASSPASSRATPSSRARGAPRSSTTSRPQDGDIVVEGKRGLDTFASTNLDFILRSKGIKNVALGGFLTNCCVESTMRSAYEKGFNVFTLTDCVAATSQEEHDNAIAKDYPMFSHPVTARGVPRRAGRGAAHGRQPGVRQLTWSSSHRPRGRTRSPRAASIRERCRSPAAPT